MIKIHAGSLPSKAAEQLVAWQQEINDEATYAARVEAAKKKFSQRNKKGNATFEAVKLILDEACSGARRCMYCEDSAADEVEHWQPKDLYPALVFDWSNYLFACGPCNGPKNNQFKVFDGAGLAVDVARKPNDPVVPPLAGDSVLLDPRVDDPLEFLHLDLKGTFAFGFLPTDARLRTRATYTHEVLRLDRDVLLRARKGAFAHYVALLGRYVLAKEQGVPQTNLEPLKESIQFYTGHPTVWQEIKRQRASFPEIAKLFDAAPEALTW
jgi:uncharacterized protein (TIGR02646 family)